MINTKIYKLEEDIVKLINESQIPPVVIGYLLERIQKEAGVAINQALKMEQEALMAQEQANQNAQQNNFPATPNGEPIKESDLIDVDLSK